MKKTLYTLLLLLAANLSFASNAVALPTLDKLQGLNLTADKLPIDIVMETSMGNFLISLYAKQAPKTVENFLAYIDSGFFDNTLFHRVLPGFVIQGGGFDTHMEQKTTHAPIINESKNQLKNLRGTLSMARRQDPDSATSQFFINLEDNPSLDSGFNKVGYAVFGIIKEGLPIADIISQVKTGKIKQHQNVPKEPVLILSVYRKVKVTNNNK